MYKIVIIPVLLLVLLFFAACNKPATPGPAKFTGCRISKIAKSGSDTTRETAYNFYYNDNGKVQRMFIYFSQAPNSNYYKYFTYKDNAITTRIVYAGQTDSQPADSMALDTHGRIVHIVHFFNSDIHNLQWDSYSFDGTDLLTSHRSSNYSAFYTDAIVWQDGDMLSSRRTITGFGSPSDLYSYSYYDTLYNTGTITADLSDFANYGTPIYANRHLLKATDHLNTSSLDTIRTYVYTLDTGGRITRVTESIGNVLSITRVAYECR